MSGGGASIESEESENGEDKLADNFDSSEEDIELYDYENEITNKMWMPSEPKLYAIYNGHKFVNYKDN